MRLNTFEAVGISLSIAVMAIALWLIRIETTGTAVQNMVDANQAAILTSTEDGQSNSVADALDRAFTNGVLTNLVVDDVVFGTGDAVTTGDTVLVHYSGRLQNGQEFDNSYTRAEPFSFTVGQGRVIQGWEEGVLGMQAGGQRILVIPSDLAYGDRGIGPIPPRATLVFTIELLEIN